MQSILRVVVTAILARILDPEHFGIIAAAMIVISFTTMLSQVGLAPALVQAEELSSRILDIAFSLSILIGLLMCVLFYFLNPLISLFFEIDGLLPVLNVLILLFPIMSIIQISTGILQRKMKFKKMAGLDVISYLVGYGIIGIVLSYYGYGVWSLVWATIIQSILYAILLIIVNPHKFKLCFRFSEISGILKYGSSFTLVKFFNFFAMKGDYIVVGKLLGADSLGIYSRAYGLMNAPNSVTGKVMQTVFFSSFSRIQNDREKTSLNLERGLEILFLLIIPTSLLCYLLAPELVILLLGPKWNLVVLPFQILAISIIFRMAYKMMASMVLGTGKAMPYAQVQFFFMIAALAGSYIGAKLGGTPGTAVGVSLAILINYLLIARLVIRHSNLEFMDLFRSSIPGLVISIFFCVISFPLVYYLRLMVIYPILIVCFLTLLYALVGIIIIIFEIRLPGSKHGLWFIKYIKNRVQNIGS